MNKTCVRCGGGFVLAIGLVVGALAFSNRVQPAFGDVKQGSPSTAGPHYTIVETEGHNLVVTDNSTARSTSTRWTRGNSRDRICTSVPKLT